MKRAAFCAIIASLAGLTVAQVQLTGGHVSTSFVPCSYYGLSNAGCGVGEACCAFTHTYNNFTSDFCMNPSQTLNSMTGTYQDTENYPFAIYNWNCGQRGVYSTGGASIYGGAPLAYDPYSLNYVDQWGHADIQGLPTELINNGNWLWAWGLLLGYIGSSSWILGYVLFIPVITVQSIYNWGVFWYGFFIMLFENPNRLSFEEWLLFPGRRLFVQGIWQTLGLFSISIPILSSIGLPILGGLTLADYLDWQSWEQMGWTLSIPFGTGGTGVGPAGYPVSAVGTTGFQYY